jgi:hypothetical protein
MRAVDTHSWLAVWDAGHSQRPERWALTALAQAEPGADINELAELSVGQRDARLLALRCQLFGSRLALVENCPGCGEDLEVELDALELLLPVAEIPDVDLVLRGAGCRVCFRLPNSRDLIAAAECGDLLQAQALLVERCVTSAHQGDDAIAAAALPPGVAEALSNRMSELDPQADLHLALSCAECRHQWRVAFDILPFLWSELNAWATRILRDVHQLASAYGWSEADILALKPSRRRQYLAMVGA